MNYEAEIARLQERMDDMEAYRKTQNSALERLDAKYDKLLFWIVGLFGMVTMNLAILIVRGL